MECTKCGAANSENEKFCKKCGATMTTRKTRKPKRNKFLYALVLLVAFLGLGLGLSQLIGNDEPEQALPQEETESAEEQVVEEEPVEEPAEVEEEMPVEEPETQVSSEEQVEGTVTKAENITHPSDQEEKVEPKKVDKTAIIKGAQSRVYTILTEGGQGSGFLFTETGMVVTNAHVVAGYTDVIVRNVNGQDQEGTVVGISAESDIALIQVKDLTGIEPLEVEMAGTAVGTEVIALGSPSGFENTASMGYLTGIDRDFYQEFTYEDIYQIDAALAPGSSGGPLLDAGTGKVIGINSLLFPDGDSIGFSIPMYSMYAQLDSWAKSPMGREAVAAIFPVYDDFDSYEDDNYEFDYSTTHEFTDESLREFVTSYQEFYELALNEEDFYYVQNLLVYQSDIYNSMIEYIDQIAGKGMEHNFNKLDITGVEIKEDHAMVQTNEAFEFKDAQGNWSLQERSKVYTIVMDDYGFFYVSDIVNVE
ncbi:trypsin-like peptidase domain-containing protein [Planococcus sp. ISL-109]|uniref:trypsin-like peptidase domain-containing protein n=1 Tax=Planococcus sp. ISL-109 TaxID=2819166 RepID=UPI001BEB1F45|nr:trypsin-like peptidase domain-containing protein [Planococcus sp. ISL-109]MBT2581559.1 trypsin-like peptidase domain-containing protein [Planococcus sp. ISL-109]